jgi:hypothetical protein
MLLITNIDLFNGDTKKQFEQYILLKFKTTNRQHPCYSRYQLIRRNNEIFLAHQNKNNRVIQKRWWAFVGLLSRSVLISQFGVSYKNEGKLLML